VTGVKNPDALKWVLRGKLIRRTAKLLGLEGRKRIFYDVTLNPKQQKLYDEAEKAMWLAVEEEITAGNKDAIDFAKAALEEGRITNLIRIPNGAARLVRLQQIIENPALIGGPDDSAIMDDFEQKVIDSRPEPWVFFFKYKESCNLMAERLRKKNLKVGVYNGDVATEVRTNLEDQFQAGDLDVLCGTLDAMREGITLTKSHLMGFGTRAFVPAHNEQAEMREDRLGQQELVRVYIPQAEGTVATDKVHAINKLKESIVRTVLEQDKIEEVAH
jgi:SNF2 family DNA or RNA helicase